MLYEPLPNGRVCRKCGNWYPCAALKKKRNHPSGVDALCRVCNRAQASQYFHDHHDNVLQKHRNDYAVRKDELDERNKASYHRNPSKNVARVVTWRGKHPDSVKKYNRNWRQANPVKQQIYKQRRIAKQAQLPNTFTANDWRDCLQYWRHCCVYCGNQRGFWSGMTQDHWVAVINGGGYTPDNILPACATCNFSKHDSDPVEWLTKKLGKRKAQAKLAEISAYFATVRSQA